jgi:ABC-type nitrate/sulfonate/bicarbonate transport system permease component
VTELSDPTPRAGGLVRRNVLVSILSRVLDALALPVLLLALWWIISARAQNFYFPSLHVILSEFGPTWFEGRLTSDVLPSVVRLLCGYGLALIIGVGLGMAAGLSPLLRAFTEPVLEFFRAVPPPVLVPLLMLFVGIGSTMKVVVIAVGAMWPILLNTVQGVRGVDEVLRDTGRCYQLRRTTTWRTVILRGASPQIVAGARQALSIAIVLMVISEMFAANNGLGFAIVQFQRSFALPEMWTGIILLGALGVLLALAFRVAERRVLFWYEGQRQTDRGGTT